MARGVKTGGRQKGAVNKPKRALLALIQEHYPNYHPILEMAKIANDEDADVKLRFDAHKEVAQYVEAKRKALEYTDPDGKPIVPAFVMTLNGKSKG